jgi:hypothetical protein
MKILHFKCLKMFIFTTIRLTNQEKNENYFLNII